jgi:hypothetical protein
MAILFLPARQAILERFADPGAGEVSPPNHNGGEEARAGLPRAAGVSEEGSADTPVRLFVVAASPPFE